MNRLLTVLLVLSLVFTMSSCEIVAGIFELGFWVGVILVVILVGLVYYFLRKLK